MVPPRTLGLVIVAACSIGSVGASATALKPFDPVAFKDTVEATAKELMVPGAMVLLHTPQGDFVFGYGTTELGVTIAPRANTHFRAASNTKTMTAVVIVQLAQEGKLRLDDPVSKYVSGVSNGDNVTIAELLRMRSGLYDLTEAPEVAASLDHDPTKVWTPEELLALAFKRPPLFAPGKEYDYCNTNYVLRGLIAEKIAGEPLAGLFQNRLFGPLGMKHTLLPPSTSNTIPEPYAHGYLYGSSSYALSDAPYPADLQVAAKSGTLKPNDDTSKILPTPRRPAASSLPQMISPPGYVRWSGAKFSTPTISANGSTALNCKIQVILAVSKYGYGISLLTFGPNSIYFHGGEMPGYNSFMGHDPVNDVTLIVWTNLTLSLDGQPTANTMMLRMLDRIYTVSPLQPKQ